MGTILFNKLFKLWSKLPMPLMYISLGLPLLIVALILQPRRRIVNKNLSYILPQSNSWYKLYIRLRYYIRMSVLLTEVLKMNNLNTKKVSSLIKIRNSNTFRANLEKGRSCIILTAHFGNWEWMTHIPERFNCKGYAVYQPLSNKFFDKFLLNLRQNFNTEPLTKNTFMKKILSNYKYGKSSIYCILLDQSPLKGQSYYTNFFGREVPFYNQITKLVEKLDLDIYYLQYHKPQLNKHSFEVSLDPLNSNNIIQDYKQRLEQDVRIKPYDWLLTHNRFKHQRN